MGRELRREVYDQERTWVMTLQQGKLGWLVQGFSIKWERRPLAEREESYPGASLQLESEHHLKQLYGWPQKCQLVRSKSKDPCYLKFSPMNMASFNGGIRKSVQEDVRRNSLRVIYLVRSIY